MYRKHAFVFTDVEKGIICADCVPPSLPLVNYSKPLVYADCVPHSLPLVNCSEPLVNAVCPTPCL